MGKKRPRRGQNGSGKRLFCPLAVTIVVLVATYWYGGEDDAATHSKGKCEPSPASTRRSQSSKVLAAGSLSRRRVVLIPT